MLPRVSFETKLATCTNVHGCEITINQPTLYCTYSDLYVFTTQYFGKDIQLMYNVQLLQNFRSDLYPGHSYPSTMTLSPVTDLPGSLLLHSWRLNEIIPQISFT